MADNGPGLAPAVLEQLFVPFFTTKRDGSEIRLSLCYRERWSPHRFEHIGKVLVLPPGETVQARSDVVSQQTSVLCYLRPEPIREWFDRDLEWTGRRLLIEDLAYVRILLRRSR